MFARALPQIHKTFGSKVSTQGSLLVCNPSLLGREVPIWLFIASKAKRCQIYLEVQAHGLVLIFGL